MALGLLIDTSRCVGCGACRAACQINHGLAPDENFISFDHEEKGEFPNVTYHTAPRQCGHCADAPCVAVCPTGASFRAEDGTVQVDEGKCIGCGYCAQVCPYQARVRRASGVYSKCSLCAERRARGEAPLCAGVCPVGARWVGDVDDPASEISQEIVRLNAEPAGGDLTGSRLYYAR